MVIPVERGSISPAWSKHNASSTREEIDLRAIIPDSGQGRDYGRYRSELCLWHEDHSPSLLIYSDGYACRACGARGTAWKYLEEHDLLTPVRRQQIRAQAAYAPEPEPDTPALPDGLADACVINITPELSYWLQCRGISPALASRYRLGASADGSEITIPVVVDGQLRNIRRRLIASHKQKYKSWKDADGLTYGKNRLFNGDAIRDQTQVIITEGEFDAIVTQEQMGIPCVTPTSGSGSWDDLDFTPRFAQVDRVYVIQDRDLAGLRGGLRIAERLGDRRCLIVPLPGRIGHKGDLTDFFTHAGGTKFELLALMTRATPAYAVNEKSAITIEYEALEEQS